MAKTRITITVERFEDMAFRIWGNQLIFLDMIEKYLQENWQASLLPLSRNKREYVYPIIFEDERRAMEFMLRYG